MPALGDIRSGSDPNVVSSGFSLPVTGLVDGMEFDLIVGGGVVDALDIGFTQGTRFWRMKWVENHNRWHPVGCTPAGVYKAAVDTVSTTAYNSYGGQHGVDTITIPWGGRYHIDFGFRIALISAGESAVMSWRNAETHSDEVWIAPNDLRAVVGTVPGSWSGSVSADLKSWTRQGYIQPMFKSLGGGPVQVLARWMKLAPVWLSKHDIDVS